MMTQSQSPSGYFPASDPLGRWLAVLQERETHSQADRLSAIQQLKTLSKGPSAQLRVITALAEALQKDDSADVVQALLDWVLQLKLLVAVMPLVHLALADVAAVFQPDSDGEATTTETSFKQSDKGIRIRCKAIKALGMIGDERALTPLMELLNERHLNYRIRLEAAEALGRLGDRKAVAPLIDLVSDERESSLYVKESAVKALGMLGDIRALDPLLHLFESKKGLKEKFRFLAEQTLLAIGRLGAKQGGEQVDHALLNALIDPSSTIRIAAAESIGELGEPHYLPALTQRLFDESQEVAQSALASIYKIGDTPALRDLLEHENLPHYLREEILDFLLETEPDDLPPE
jgi:HEAT repeat protein